MIVLPLSRSLWRSYILFRNSAHPVFKSENQVPILLLLVIPTFTKPLPVIFSSTQLLRPAGKGTAVIAFQNLRTSAVRGHPLIKPRLI